MNISVLDLFKIGIGPSSSHTVGPMLAARRFLDELLAHNLAAVKALRIDLYGSLSATGKGHGTDGALIAGLRGEYPDSVDPETVRPQLEQVISSGVLELAGQHAINFAWSDDCRWHDETLPFHPNAVRFTALDAAGTVIAENTYYSIGGGFVVDQHEAEAGDSAASEPAMALPYDFASADELLTLTRTHGLSIAELMAENEKAWRSEQALHDALMDIWAAMRDCIANGLHKEGVLPGGLDVKRRAMAFHKNLIRSARKNLISSSMSAMDWVNLYALAVNEENAGGGRIVTAPTNGAAGIIPAVLMYFMEYSQNPTDEQVVEFFLSAAAIGILCKKNASISGAEVGCQGEVGSACAMAAAGLCAVLGGTPAQVTNAAEIGLEHNLGLTCDPIGGLVQVPCIERNAIAAVKAINAAQLALRGTGEHFVSLDKAIRTMRDTGRDMHEKYKETSRGGLAVNVVEC